MLSQTDLNGQWIAFNRAGAPNSNLQCFTLNNVSVSGGNLVITTKSEAATCSSFDLPYQTYNYGNYASANTNFVNIIAARANGSSLSDVWEVGGVPVVTTNVSAGGKNTGTAGIPRAFKDRATWTAVSAL